MSRHLTARFRPPALFALVLCLVLALSASSAVGAKKKKGKKKGPTTVDITKTTNLPLLDETPGAAGVDGVTISTIDVGRAFAGRRIRDVNVTLQVVGTGTDSVDDLRATLQAPDGTATVLFAGRDPGNLLGPLTLDDETFLFPGAGPPIDPTSLYAPWQGTAYPQGSPLAAMDNGPVQGTWKLVFVDDNNGNTNVLTFWRLNVSTGRPYKTK